MPTRRVEGKWGPQAKILCGAKKIGACWEAKYGQSAETMPSS